MDRQGLTGTDSRIRNLSMEDVILRKGNRMYQHPIRVPELPVK